MGGDTQQLGEWTIPFCLFSCPHLQSDITVACNLSAHVLLGDFIYFNRQSVLKNRKDNDKFDLVSFSLFKITILYNHYPQEKAGLAAHPCFLQGVQQWNIPSNSTKTTSVLQNQQRAISSSYPVLRKQLTGVRYKFYNKFTSSWPKNNFCIGKKQKLIEGLAEKNEKQWQDISQLNNLPHNSSFKDKNKVTLNPKEENIRDLDSSSNF